MPTHCLKIIQCPCGKIINDGYGFAIGQESLYEVRADEARPAGHQDVMRDA
jgi:hypothetical protein